VDYSKVDPAGAREIFIREALVGHLHEDTWDSKLPFLTANRRTVREVQELEHKARRQDVLVDDELIYAFYDQQLPADVCNGAAFERWYRDHSRENPKLLFLTREELMRHEAAGITTQAFPKTLRLGGVDCAVAYLHEPGDPRDGVSVTVPIFALNQVSEERCDWLVPGMLREKLALLIKSLPKALRRACVPVPDSVTRFLERQPDGQAALLPQLALFVQRLVGAPVSVADFNPDTLPAHAHMNIRVLDDGKQELGMGRDLLALQRQFGDVAQLTFRDTSLDFERDSVTSWDLGDLPATLKFARNRQQLTGFPALAVEDDRVALRLFDTARTADAAMRGGVIRLLQYALKERDEALQISRQNLRMADKVFESTLEGIMITDANGVIETVNPAFSRITG